MKKLKKPTNVTAMWFCALTLVLATLVLCAFTSGNSVAQDEPTVTFKTIQNDRTGYWQAKAVYPQLPGETALVRWANERLAEAANAALDEFIQQALDTVSRSGRPQEAHQFQLRSTVSVFQPDLISVLYTADSNLGGDLRAVTQRGLTFGLKEGQPATLQLEDLFVPEVGARELASRAVIGRLKENPAARLVREGKVTELSEEVANHFVLTPTALSFLIPSDYVAPDTTGSLVVRVPFFEFDYSLQEGVVAGAQSELPVTWRTIQNDWAGYWQARAIYPEFQARAEEDSPELVRWANERLALAARSNLDAFVREASDTVRDSGRPQHAHEFELRSTVATFQPDLISVLCTAYSYTGGAHGMVNYTGLNFRLKDGAPINLHLQDLFRPGVEARRVASEVVIQRLQENPEASFVHDGTFRELSEEGAERFVLTTEAVNFLIPPYEVAPYAAGSFVVRVPFTELGTKLDPVILAQTPGEAPPPTEAAIIPGTEKELPVTWRTLRNERADYWLAKAVYPQFDGDTALVGWANERLAEEAGSALEAYLKDVSDTVSQSGRPQEPYQFDLRPTVSVFQPDLISVLYTAETDTGGTQREVTYRPLNFGLQEDKPATLQLQDLFRPGVEARQVASGMVMERLKGNPAARFVREGRVTELTEAMVERFVITPTTLAFLFPPEEVAPAAAGSFLVQVPFAEWGDPIKSTVLASAQSELPVVWKTVQNDWEGYWRAQAVYPEFQAGPEGTPSDLIRWANERLTLTARSGLDGFVREVSDKVNQSGRPQQAYRFAIRPLISVFEKELISVLYVADSDLGGEQPKVSYTALNFGLKEGTPATLQLQDLFAPGVEARQATSDLVMGQLRENSAARFVREEKVKELNQEMAERFVLTAEGVDFLFPPNEVAPYDAGSFVVRVPFSEFGNRLAPAVLARVQTGPPGTTVARADTEQPVTPAPKPTEETPAWGPEPEEVLADKFVPILSVGEGIRVGVARVSGPKAAVDTVKAVAQIEGEYKKIARGRAFVPVATEDVVKNIERVAGVNVTGYADLRF